MHGRYLKEELKQRMWGKAFSPDPAKGPWGPPAVKFSHIAGSYIQSIAKATEIIQVRDDKVSCQGNSISSGRSFERMD